jgi:uncharacterized membrane protein
MNRAGTFSISEALRVGWETLKRNLELSIGIGVVGFGVTVLLNGFTTATQSHGSLSMSFVAIMQMLQIFLALVWTRYALALSDGRSVGPRELMPDGTTFLGFLAASFLYGLLVSVGLLLLVVPGVYLAVRYGFVGFLVADGRADVLGAFRQSAQLTRGLRWSLLAFGLVLFAMNLLGALLCGLGLLATVPVSAFALAFVYRRLVGARAGTERFVVGPPAPIAV